MEPPERRRRIEATLGLPGVSERALAQVLACIDDEASTSMVRREIATVRDEHITVATNHGQVVKTMMLPCWEDDAQVRGLKYIHPAAYLSWLCGEVPALAEVLASFASTVVKFVIYNDGADCGNVLAPDHTQKVELWYWSILELGSERLCHKDAQIDRSERNDVLAAFVRNINYTTLKAFLRLI